MEAIILAGGLGTRLRSVLSDVPKPMAPIRGKPFLEYLLRNLSNQGVRRVVLSTCYKHELIEAHFGRTFANMEIAYSRETTPLGTGGALQKSLALVRADHCLVLNGDTYLKLQFSELIQKFSSPKADILMSLKSMAENTRYGAVSVDQEGKITAFGEGIGQGPALVNVGVFVVKSDIFKRFSPQQAPFTFEKDFMAKNLGALKVFGHKTEGYFIDIGVPEDLIRAQSELPEIN